MTVTTDYGTWTNHAGGYNTTAEADIADYINGGPSDWVNRVMDEGYLDRMAEAYRAEINAALPHSVSLCGSDFYGPYYEADQDWDGYPVDEHGSLDISEIIAGIDFDPIMERFDPDLANQDATLSVGTSGWQTLTIGDSHLTLPVRSFEVIPAALLHQLAADALAEHEWELTGPWAPTSGGFTAPATRA